MVPSERIVASNVSDAWIKSVELIDAAPGHHVFHHVVTIERPDQDNEDVRDLVDGMLTTCGLQTIDSVRNTVFPYEMSRGRDPEQLAARYRRLYPALRDFPKNHDGTYFGRMVALPDGNSGTDQLNIVFDKLTRGGKRRKTVYEMDLSDVGAMQIHSSRKDQKRIMGFPCLSFCAFQRDEDMLHLVAHYRNHYLRERAYGNYLGLGQLLSYLAKHADLDVGNLTVVAGHAAIEGTLPLVRRTTKQARTVIESE